MARIHGEFVLLPQTKVTRAVTFRLDRVGAYLLFWENSMMVAGLTFQLPEFITGNPHYTPGFSSWSLTLPRD